MMTTANVPYYIKGRKCKSGNVYKTNVSKKKKKKEDVISEAFTVPVKGGLWKVPKLGKVGVWRTVNGRRYFFPKDGSGPTPNFPWAKKGISLKKIAKSAIKKIVGVAKGNKKSFKKDESASSKKTNKKKEKKTKIPDRDKTLDQVEELMLKASRSKGGKKLLGVLKNMQSALKSDNPGEFRKAEADISKAARKLSKRKGR